MFCPKCGRSDQVPETYCRQCGVYLPDLSKSVRVRHTPAEHIKVNTVLTTMSVITCFTLAILLWLVLGFREYTIPLIYVTASLLFAMGIWQAQTLWRTLQLRTFLKRNDPQKQISEIPGSDTGKLLDEADLENMVPVSVTDRTTRELSATNIKSSEAQHQSDRTI